MASAWNDLGNIAPGGTVFALARDGHGHVWLATGAGLFVQEGVCWQPLRYGQPLPVLTALAASADTVFVGGARGELLYTRDGGRQWYRGRQDQVTTTITCIAPSPDFERDGIALAGTSGAGILRTADGGRTWALCNFGLEDFIVTALATAPTWGRREFVFAVTEHGLYRSPNGGRAWKRSDAGLEGISIQTLALSPTFEADATLLAGAENGRLYRSTDGGRTWALHGEPWRDTDMLAPINALLWHEAGLWLGAGNGQLWRSTDGGATWQLAAQCPAPVLALTGDAAAQFAGLFEAGVWYTPAPDAPWMPAPDFAARGILRLTANAGGVFAWGPREGVWHATPTGDWQPLPLPDGLNLTALETVGDTLLLGSDAGLFMATAGGPWRQALSSNYITALAWASASANLPAMLWAGCQTGQVFCSADGGTTWQTLPAPQPGFPVLALAAQGPLTFAATLGPQGQRLIWLWDAARRTWRLAHHLPPGPASAQFLHAPTGLWTVFGTSLWWVGQGGWREVFHAEQPLLRLTRAGHPDGLYLLTEAALFYAAADGDFVPQPLPVTGACLRDLSCDAQGRCLLLTVGGRLWQRANL